MSPSQGNAACATTGCTLGGDIVINNTTGTIVSEDVTATGFLPSGPFTTNTSIFNSSSLTYLIVADSVGNQLNLGFLPHTAGSLIGYTGGPLDTSTTINTIDTLGSGFWTLTASALTPQTSIPEPSSLALLLSALAGLGALLGGRRLLRQTAPG